jgi:hypothetical protein
MEHVGIFHRRAFSDFFVDAIAAYVGIFAVRICSRQRSLVSMRWGLIPWWWKSL